MDSGAPTASLALPPGPLLRARAAPKAAAPPRAGAGRSSTTDPSGPRGPMLRTKTRPAPSARGAPATARGPRIATAAPRSAPGRTRPGGISGCPAPRQCVAPPPTRRCTRTRPPPTARGAPTTAHAAPSGPVEATSTAAPYSLRTPETAAPTIAGGGQRRPSSAGISEPAPPGEGRAGSPAAAMAREIGSASARWRTESMGLRHRVTGARRTGTAHRSPGSTRRAPGK